MPRELIDECVLGELVLKAAARGHQFFIREKSNYEWEAGYGKAAGVNTARADSPLAALRALAEMDLVPELPF